MKKIKSLLTIASILGVGAATALTSPKDYTIENNDQKVYIVSVAGDIAHDNVNAIKNRNTVLNQLDYLVGNENYEITNTYDTLINGFAIKTYDSIADVISKISGVASVAESKGYARPTADQASALGTGELTEDEIKAMKFENYSAESMSATSEDVKAVLAANGAATEESKGGKGVTVGIMDTGLYLNQVEGTAQRTSAGSKASNSAAFVDSEDVVDVLSAEKVAAVKTKLNGKTGVRINKKVAFAFDYADDDNNVDPTGGSAASEHGTHVASLAAANGEDFQGVAPNAQLAIFKVFNNNNSGAYDADIIEALEDAAKLGIDTVNLSLGSPLDESSDNVSDATNVAIKACADAGVIVNYAAGNDGKGSFTGTKGYGDWTTDVVETGILGNSSLTDEYANIVAATANDRAFYDSIMLVRGEGEGAADIAVSYDDQVVNKTGSSIHYDTEHKFTDLITGSDLDYVYVGGFGTESDYSGLDCQGKVVVVNRGDLTFYNKYVYAQKAGASGLIVVNNNSSTTFNFSFDFNDHNPEFPIVSVFQSMGDVFKAGAGTDRYGKLSLATNVQEDAPDGHTMSSFSSDGSSANLDLVPTISAPGSDIMGAVEATTVGENSGLTGYDNMSGTS
ncbi:MAG: S8 family serine peptidase, partial [Bacilli bacterium]